MIIALKRDIRKEEQEHLIAWLESYGVRTHISEGEFQTVIGLVGDTTRIDTDLISGLDIVQSEPEIPSGRHGGAGDGPGCLRRRELPDYCRPLFRGDGGTGGNGGPGSPGQRSGHAPGRRLQTEDFPL